MREIKRVADDYMRRETIALTNLRTAVELGKELEAKLLKKATKAKDLKAKLERADQVNIEQAERMKVLKEQLEELQREKREKEEKLASEIQTLKDDMALTRFTTRAAVMRRHLKGNILLADAQAELDFYLSHVGSEKDLDADDELDDEEEGLEKEVTIEEIDRAMEEPKGVGEEASKEKASGSGALEVEAAEGEKTDDAGDEDVVPEEETEGLVGSDAPAS